MKDIKRVVVTGGNGQIAYSLLFRLAAGDLFGLDQPISLYIKDLKDSVPQLEGVRMELMDCAFPLLSEIRIGHDPAQMYEEVDVAFLVGAKPRAPGQERKDLLHDNGKIFVEEGKGLNRYASKDVRVLVVGNPCNTNCLIAMHHAPDVPRRNFHAMMRLDQNRAKALLAEKARVTVDAVKQMTIWGNHSATQVPDFTQVKIKGAPATSLITDTKWLKEEFFNLVQKRGAAVLAARGKSSAASAANAAIDAMRSLFVPTEKDDWFTTALTAEGNPYGIDEGLVFGFPCRSQGKGEATVIAGLPWDSFIEEKIALTQKELLEERDMITGLLT